MNPIQAVIGAVYPAKMIAGKIIRQTLAQNGLQGSLYPIDELAAYSVRMAKFMGSVKRDWYRTHLYDAAIGIAHTTALISFGGSDWSSKKLRESLDSGNPNIVWEILAKHNPGMFSAGVLEITQMKNAAKKSIARDP